MKGVLSILVTGLGLSVAVAASAGAAVLRTGVVANDFALPTDAPGRVIVESAGATDGSPDAGNRGSGPTRRSPSWTRAPWAACWRTDSGGNPASG